MSGEVLTKCEFCGKFIDRDYEASHAWFAYESAAYCRRCAVDMPPGHSERQVWIVRNLP